MGCKIRIILFYDPLFYSPPNFLFFEQKSQGEKIEETKEGRGIIVKAYLSILMADEVSLLICWVSSPRESNFFSPRILATRAIFKILP